MFNKEQNNRINQFDEWFHYGKNLFNTALSFPIKSEIGRKFMAHTMCCSKLIPQHSKEQEAKYALDLDRFDSNRSNSELSEDEKALQERWLNLKSTMLPLNQSKLQQIQQEYIQCASHFQATVGDQVKRIFILEHVYFYKKPFLFAHKVLGTSSQDNVLDLIHNALEKDGCPRALFIRLGWMNLKHKLTFYFHSIIENSSLEANLLKNKNREEIYEISSSSLGCSLKI